MIPKKDKIMRPPVYALTKIDRIIRRHKYVLLGMPLIGLSGAYFYIQNTTPVYEAKTQILFHTDDPFFVKSQETHITAQDIIHNAIKKLENTGKNANTSSSFKTLNIHSTPLLNHSEASLNPSIAEKVLQISQNLSAIQPPNSYIIQLSYRSEDAAAAANMVNAITFEYIKKLSRPTIERSKKQSHPTRTHEILGKTNPTDLTDLLHRQVIQAREDLDLFKQQEGRAQPSTFLMAISRAKEKEYEQALINMAEAKAALYPFLNENGNLVLNLKAPAILHSTHLRTLSYKHDELSREYNHLARKYGHKHPQIIAVTSAISLIKEQIEREQNDIMQRVHNEYKAAQNTVETFERPENMEAIRQLQLLRQERLVILENKYTTAMAIYDAYTQNAINAAHNIAPQKHTTPPEVSWISQAFTPQNPIYPKARKILGFSTLLCTLLGIALAALLEKLRPTFLSGRELEEVTNAPCYALIPRIDTAKSPLSRKKNNAIDIFDNSNADTADAVRSLRLNLKLHNNTDDNNKVITLTSSYNLEGKTTLSLWMARLSAKAGERVIIIDANLRSPEIHNAVHAKNNNTLAEYITRQAKMEDIINTDDPSGAHIIFGRAAPQNAIDYLSSERMENLIRALRKAYDLIIIDTPPCMTTPDAKAVAKLSDTVLYTVQWNKTRRETVESGLSQFITTDKTHIATVLTQINLQKHIEYGFGHSFFDYKTDKDYALS